MRRPPWRVIGALWILGLAAVVSGLFVSPFLIGLGALLFMIAPLGFLLAAPPPLEADHDYVADAYARVFDPRTSRRSSHDL